MGPDRDPNADPDPDLDPDADADADADEPRGSKWGCRNAPDFWEELPVTQRESGGMNEPSLSGTLVEKDAGGAGLWLLSLHRTTIR